MLARLLGIRDEDRRDTLVAFAVLAAMMAGHALLETARDALFLAKLDADRLPLTYIAIAGLALVVGAANRRLLERFSARRLLAFTLLVGAGITAAFYVFLDPADPLMLGAFYVWVGLLATMVVLQFWLQLAAVFDVGQAKRVFSIVGAGGLVGATLGSLTASAVLAIADARALMIAGVVCFVVAAVLPIGFSKPPEPAVPRRRASRERARPFRSPYLSRLFVVALTSAVLITGVDYLFKAAVAADHADAASLGAFFARFYAVINAVSLVVQLAIAPRLLRSLGVHRTLLFLPGALLFGAAGFAVFGGLVPAVLLKSADGALRHSVNRTGNEILYLPLTADVRARFKSFVEAVGQRGGQALASVLLLAATLAGAEHFHIAVALVGLAVVWLAAVRTIEPHYLELFRRQLREGKVDTNVAVPDLDLGSLEALIAALSSPDDNEVLAALDMFAAFKKTNLIPALILFHPSSAVVTRAFDLFFATERTDVLRVAERLLDHSAGAAASPRPLSTSRASPLTGGRALEHPEPEVRAAALRLFASAGAHDDKLASHVDSEHPELRAVALAWQARRGLASDESINAGLEALVDSDDVRDRLAALYAVRDAPPERFAHIALRLADDPDWSVPPRVARAMAETPSPEYLPALVRLLAHRSGRAAARVALLKLGEPALEALRAALLDPAAPRPVRLHVPRTLARFDDPRAWDILIERVQVEQDDRVLFKILRALNRMQFDGRDGSFDRAALLQRARSLVEQAVTALSWRLCVSAYLERNPSAKTPAAQLLLQLTEEKEQGAMYRTFRLLPVVLPREDFRSIYFGLRSEEAKTRASTRELLSHVIDPPVRDLLLCMVDELSDLGRLEAAQTLFRPPHRSAFVAALDADDATLHRAYAKVLRDVLDDPNLTLRGVAGHHITELGLGELADADRRAEDSSLTSLAERASGLLAKRRRPVSVREVREVGQAQ
ncbi:MAG: Npt1/Npt2 family nucleotide transporter [Deltaproteobacteria bacterium]